MEERQDLRGPYEDTTKLEEMSKEFLIKLLKEWQERYKPENPDVILDTDKQTIKESAESAIQFLEDRNIIVRPMVKRPRRIGL